MFHTNQPKIQIKGPNKMKLVNSSKWICGKRDKYGEQ